MEAVDLAVLLLEVDRKRKFYFRPKTETETESR